MNSARVARHGFSLLELIIVIAVVMLLTAMLMPALRHVHENAHRIICMSHLQQMGQAFVMYSANYKDQLPRSTILQLHQNPQDLMAAKRGGADGDWDGQGLLYQYGFCPTSDCFYCPSHRGQHSHEQYANRWIDPIPTEAIFTNYHYAGHVKWSDTGQRRTLDDGVNLVLATDGLRTASDFNHLNGMNVLRGDGSVRWREDTAEIYNQLPVEVYQVPNASYQMLWELVE